MYKILNNKKHTIFLIFVCLTGFPFIIGKSEREKPNVILVMADDQGYRDAEFMGHPKLKTPEMDEMAAHGLTFTRFYAAASVCTPTRANVLTGRHPNRFGAFTWGHTLRPQELTIAEALNEADYQTGHFGKWHLGSMVAGVAGSPGESGFDRWVSAYNFYDTNPWLSDNGIAKKFEGGSAKVTSELAIDFIERSSKKSTPFFAVVWFSNPHKPYEPKVEIEERYSELGQRERKHLSEIVAVDRALGRLRSKVRELEIADQTVLWYTSDNGGKAPFANNGDLRGEKGTLWEGGLRVPSIIEWPGHLKPRSTDVVATTSDIYPTILDLTNIKPDGQPRPIDGTSLMTILEEKKTKREKPIGFWQYPKQGRNTPNNEFMRMLHEEQESGDSVTVRAPVVHLPGGSYPKAKKRAGWAVWLEGNWKLHRHKRPNRYRSSGRYSLYNLSKDPEEKHNRIDDYPKRAARMKGELMQWQQSIIKSLNGNDY